MKTAFLFPGQGSQKVGMGRHLVELDAEARALFAQADAQLDFALSELCFNGPHDELTDTVNQQPALFVTSVATYRVMRNQGWAPPAAVAGHSMGELSALTAAGSLSFVDGLALVRRRGLLMKEAGQVSPGGMAAILALDADQVAPLCARVQAETGQSIQVANDNCPGQIVISGQEEALAQVMALATAAGARKVVRLPITIAAHSPLMGSAMGSWAQAVDETVFAAPLVPVIGNTTAASLSSPAAIRQELKDQMTGNVRWRESMMALSELEIEAMVEVGPGDVLTGLMKRIQRKVKRLKFDVGREYE